MTQHLKILQDMEDALDDAYAAGVRNSKRQEWSGLTPEDWDYIEKNCGSIRSAIKTAEALLKEKNQ
jgi:hypothetical protein